MFWSLLLVGAVILIVWVIRARRPAPPPPAPSLYDETPGATDWGRLAPPQAQQPGVGGQVMGGLATGLAIGAGALAAQEIGRHMLGGEHSQHGLGSVDGAHDHGSAAGSDLARDAGLDAIGRDDAASWDDAGASFSDDGGGGDS